MLVDLASGSGTGMIIICFCLSADNFQISIMSLPTLVKESNDWKGREGITKDLLKRIPLDQANHLCAVHSFCWNAAATRRLLIL